VQGRREGVIECRRRRVDGDAATSRRRLVRNEGQGLGPLAGIMSCGVPCGSDCGEKGRCCCIVWGRAGGRGGAIAVCVVRRVRSGGGVISECALPYASFKQATQRLSLKSQRNSPRANARGENRSGTHISRGYIRVTLGPWLSLPNSCLEILRPRDWCFSTVLVRFLCCWAR
jgi:hypothetical protein